MLGLICAGVVLCMTTWFSATAITPELIALWRLSGAQVAWLTNAVQLGFVMGALLSSFVSLPDLVPLRKLMGVSALVAAAANLCLLWAPSTGWLLAARFITGVALAGIYPPALKLTATWFVRGRGTALGWVIAALTLGSASPHLIRSLTDRVDWQIVVEAASACTVAGAAVLVLFAREGPFPFSKAVFNPRYLGVVLKEPAIGPCEPRLPGAYVGAVCDVGMVPGLYARCFRTAWAGWREIGVAGDVCGDCVGDGGSGSGGDTGGPDEPDIRGWADDDGVGTVRNNDWDRLPWTTVVVFVYRGFVGDRSDWRLGAVFCNGNGVE